MRKVFFFTLLSLFLLTVSICAEDEKVIPLFSPEDSCGLTIQEYISRAQDYIYVAMYYFTLRRLAQELVRAHKRGVDVKVFLDSKQKGEKYAKGRFLERKGVDIKYKDDETSGYMHAKFCVIDDKIVITGSFNWTVSADLRNDEDLLIIVSTDVAKSYKNYFNKLWEDNVPDTYQYKDKVDLEKIKVK